MLPNFKHDCSNCVYLGSWKGYSRGLKEPKKHDFWICPSQSYFDTWIARYGNEPQEYLSTDVRFTDIPRDSWIDAFLQKLYTMIRKGNLNNDLRYP